MFIHPFIYYLTIWFEHGCHLSFHSFCWLLGQGSNTCFIFHFIHSFILFIHPFIYYLTTVWTWVPSFISFILLIIGPRFKHVFHLSFHSFVYSFHPSIHLLFNHGSNMGAIFRFIHFVDHWAKVQTRVSSFISFILFIGQGSFIRSFIHSPWLPMWNLGVYVVVNAPWSHKGSLDITTFVIGWYELMMCYIHSL